MKFVFGVTVLLISFVLKYCYLKAYTCVEGKREIKSTEYAKVYQKYLPLAIGLVVAFIGAMILCLIMDFSKTNILIFGAMIALETSLIFSERIKEFIVYTVFFAGLEAILFALMNIL